MKVRDWCSMLQRMRVEVLLYMRYDVSLMMGVKSHDG